MTHSTSGTLTITSIDVHAEGEVGRILVGSHLRVRGTTWSERRRWCESELDWLRRLLLREPRGHPSMCGVLVLPPLDPTADGPVEATAQVEGGRVRWVRVRNVPSFAVALDREIDVPEYGTVTEIGLALLHAPADTPGTSGRNSVVMPSGRITGTSARMAALHARGELDLGVPFIHEGVLGTTFRGVLHERTTVGDLDAVVPSIQGRGLDHRARAARRGARRPVPDRPDRRRHLESRPGLSGLPVPVDTAGPHSYIAQVYQNDATAEGAPA